MLLFCSVCHTRWTEACWDIYDQCPAEGCSGRLTVKPPKPPKQKKQKPPKRVDLLPLLKKVGLPT